VDMVSFTGSTRAGKQVMKSAADTIKKVALELGGKSANILLDDADFPRMVKLGVLTLMTNTGQNCNAPSRMLVPEARLAEVEIGRSAVPRGGRSGCGRHDHGAAGQPGPVRACTGVDCHGAC
jgi:acyl-CoA reductase-like NAD-dependent aldehyde dehydrogenase